MESADRSPLLVCRCDVSETVSASKDDSVWYALHALKYKVCIGVGSAIWSYVELLECVIESVKVASAAVYFRTMQQWSVI